MSTTIEVETFVKAPEDLVWEAWVTPEHVLRWNSASDDWHTTGARNDLRSGGTFSYRMEAKDGSFGFDFEGEYVEVAEKRLIRYKLSDDREVVVRFSPGPDGVQVTESFVADASHPEGPQRQGWQCILDRFRTHVESLTDKADQGA